MNTVEIDTFTQRLGRFTDRGLTVPDAEALADRLVVRDREQDDRRVCLECQYLRGVGRWRCDNGVVAGVAICAGDAPLPADLAGRTQRCSGFRDAVLGAVIEPHAPVAANGETDADGEVTY